MDLEEAVLKAVRTLYKGPKDLVEEYVQSPSLVCRRVLKELPVTPFNLKHLIDKLIEEIVTTMKYYERNLKP